MDSEHEAAAMAMAARPPAARLQVTTLTTAAGPGPGVPVATGGRPCTREAGGGHDALPRGSGCAAGTGWGRALGPGLAFRVRGDSSVPA